MRGSYIQSIVGRRVSSSLAWEYLLAVCLLPRYMIFLTLATSLFSCVLSRLLGVLCSTSRKVIGCLGDFTRLARTRPVSHELCFIGSSSVSIVNHCSTANAKNGISAAWSRRVRTVCGLGCLIVP